MSDLPHVYIQWKGTDVCLDFHCTCESENNDFTHFDGYFAYFLKCGLCGKVWKMPEDMFPTEATEEEIALDRHHTTEVGA